MRLEKNSLKNSGMETFVFKLILVSNLVSTYRRVEYENKWLSRRKTWTHFPLTLKISQNWQETLVLILRLETSKLYRVYWIIRCIWRNRSKNSANNFNNQWAFANMYGQDRYIIEIIRKEIMYARIELKYIFCPYLSRPSKLFTAEKCWSWFPRSGAMISSKLSASRE